MNRMESGDALLVVDAQVKFSQSGAPHAAPGGDDIVARIVDLARIAREREVPVVWIRRVARPQVGPGRHSLRWFGSRSPELYAEAMVALHPTIAVEDADIVLDKTRHSAFYETDLESALRNLGVRRVLIAGFTTNVCVLATAMDAIARDLDVVVLSDLTAALPIESAEGAMTASEVQAATLSMLRYSFGGVAATSEIV